MSRLPKKVWEQLVYPDSQFNFSHVTKSKTIRKFDANLNISQELTKFNVSCATRITKLQIFNYWKKTQSKRTWAKSGKRVEMYKQDNLTLFDLLQLSTSIANLVKYKLFLRSYMWASNERFTIACAANYIHHTVTN